MENKELEEYYDDKIKELNIVRTKVLNNCCISCNEAYLVAIELMKLRLMEGHNIPKK